MILSDNQKKIYDYVKKKHRFFIFLYVLCILFLVLVAVRVSASCPKKIAQVRDDRIIIQPQDVIGFNCQLWYMCSDSITETPSNTNWVIKSDAVYEQDEEGMTCSWGNNHTLYFDDNGTWVKVISTTDIQLINGANPQSNAGINPPDPCNFDSSAQWTVKAKDALNCQTVNFYITATNKGGGFASATFSVLIDNGNCFLPDTPKTFLSSSGEVDNTDIYTDATPIFWFLGVQIVFLLIWFLI